MREVITGGNELVAQAAIDVGCRFFGGYPITPSSDIAHEMSVNLPKVGGKFIQMEDEIGGISVALGAAMTGKKAMTATSGPGISLKAEQVGYGFMAEIPLVVVDVMRGGPSTGLPTRVSQGDLNQVKNPIEFAEKVQEIVPKIIEKEENPKTEFSLNEDDLYEINELINTVPNADTLVVLVNGVEIYSKIK